MQEEKRFCVYVHSKKSDGKIFYVGKGLKGRASNYVARSSYWKRIVAKHGLTVSIIKNLMVEKDAFELESLLISEIGRENLCNMTDGGEGCSGRVMSEKQKNRASAMLKGVRPEMAISAARLANSKKVGTVCGMRFDSITSACAWLSCNGYPTACKAGIHSTLKGMSRTSYGYQWRYVLKDGGLSSESFVPSAPRFNVRTLCGLKFESPKIAIEWLCNKGFKKAQSANIVSCCKGRVKTAYGYQWEYSGNKS
jgi:hypothetical protein